MRAQRSAEIAHNSEHWVDRRRILIRVGIPILILLVVALGAAMAGMEQFVIGAAPVAVVALLVSLEFMMRRNDLYPVIILFSALYIPISFSTGTASRVVLSLALTVAFTFLWFFQMVLERRFTVKPSPINLPLFLFCCATLFSLVWSSGFRDPIVTVWGSFPFVQMASALVFIMSVVTVLLTSNLITRRSLLVTIVVLFIIAGFLGFIDHILPIKLPVDTNGLFSMWIVAIAVGMGFINNKLPVWVRGLLIILALLWIYWGFIRNITWLAGWVPVFFVILVISFLRSPKLAIFLFIVLAIIIYIQWDYLSTSLSLESRTSGLTRLDAWKQNWLITKDHFLFGTGPAGYAVYYMTYFPRRAMATHNNYLDMLSQVGIVGSIFLVWLFGAIIWRGINLVKRLHGRHDFLEAFAIIGLSGTLGGLLMMMFGDWLFPFAYTQSIAGFNYSVYNWLFMGAMLALDHMTCKLKEEPS